MSKIHIIEHKRNKWFYARFQMHDWINVHNTAYADTELASLDATVISTWKIFVFMRLQSGHHVSLPLRFYSTHLFSASIDAVVKVGKIRVIWTLYDMQEDFELPDADLAIFAIDEAASMQLELNFLHFHEIQEHFKLD